LAIVTVNPYTNQKLHEYREDNLDDIKAKITSLRIAQHEWRRDLDVRLERLKEIRQKMEAELSSLSAIMTIEMGKPVAQSEAEVKKCMWLIDYITENATAMLNPESVKTEARKSYIRFDPLGTILLIMPWNFPAWQVMRAAIPAIAVGNTVLLKHASIVSGTSLKLEEIIGSDIFKSTVCRGSVAFNAIRYTDGVSFTGSTEIGAKIGEEAGQHIKKVVLELGGSDPYIVLGSANLEEAVKNCAYARMQNNGQSCIASKRFIVDEKVFDEFYRGMKQQFSDITVGDPMQKNTFLGPLSSSEQKEIVRGQVDELKRRGQVDVLGRRDDGNFVPPTIARTDAVYDQEVFGPVAILKKFKTNEEAIKLANETPYGLGASVWGLSEEAEQLVPAIETGMIFINKIVTSDPRLPFGGVKKSGLGTELSRYGLLEFTAKRTVWVN
jgi:acyl-CoA reductase-like NAD-dependent aldehyde dehydrogenase